jgi:hypothetical protein
MKLNADSFLINKDKVKVKAEAEVKDDWLIYDLPTANCLLPTEILRLRLRVTGLFTIYSLPH